MKNLIIGTLFALCLTACPTEQQQVDAPSAAAGAAATTAPLTTATSSEGRVAQDILGIYSPDFGEFGQYGHFVVTATGNTVIEPPTHAIDGALWTLLLWKHHEATVVTFDASYQMFGAEWIETGANVYLFVHENGLDFLIGARTAGFAEE